MYVRVPASERTEALLREAMGAGALTESAVVYVTDSVFEKMSEERAPEGVITVARQMEALHGSDPNAIGEIGASGEKLLLVESMRDPGNLGTVMRSCAALGIDRLILSDDCADLYNPKTIRSAMGALFRLPTVTVAAEDFARVIATLRQSGRRVFATALRQEAVSIGSFSLGKRDCFVIGNEGHGLREETVNACDDCALIPMREGNESLNAAAAAAICIWETVRATGEGQQ